MRLFDLAKTKSESAQPNTGQVIEPEKPVTQPQPVEPAVQQTAQQVNQPVAQPTGKELMKQRWKNAYRARPSAYENVEDGTVLMGFALTEDTDSLFPVSPEKQWGLEGRIISKWMISMVSLTNPQGGIIGQMEYQEALKRLRPYMIARGGEWVLIRAMTHAELDNLFDGLPRMMF